MDWVHGLSPKNWLLVFAFRVIELRVGIDFKDWINNTNAWKILINDDENDLWSFLSNECYQNYQKLLT